MNKKRRLIDQMKKEGIELLIASTPENVMYLTDYWSLSQKVVRGVQTYALFSKSMKKPVLIIPISDGDLVGIKDLKVVPYGSFYINKSTNKLSRTEQVINEIFRIERKKSGIQALIDVIKEENFDSSVIGVENEIPYQVLNKLKREFPELKIKEATDLFHRVRMVKTNEEIKKLKKSANIIERGIESTLQCLTEGISEIEVAKELKKEIIEKGADIGFIVVGFGTHSAYPNAHPSKNKLKRGDIVRFDVGCLWDHYYSDTAKTIVFGKKETTKQKKYYDVIVNAQKKGIESAKPGVRVSEIYNIMIKTIQKKIPHYNRHHFGHGIGLEVHQPPIITGENTTLLQKDMVINIEAPYYELGFGGLQVEDTLIITEKSNEVITTIDEILEVL
ncbi:hypothetical protein DRN58_01750 [Thermococci archaeon]|nr:MAG: hypothetical protein DRN58_01750 [Thermococci archaeon]